MVLERVKENIIKYSERNAFHTQEKFYTYKQFGEKLSDIRKLIENNADNSVPLIGFTQNDDFETYSTIWGILFSGFGFVPINPENPVDRNINIMEQTGIKILLSSVPDENLESACKKLNIKFLLTSELEKTELNINLPNVSEDNLAYLLFTSGSTGTPKGVPITRKNMNTFFDYWLNYGYDFNENDRWLQMFDMTFDLSVMCYVSSLCTGACLYTIPYSGVKYTHVYANLEEHDLTCVLLVPSILTYIRPYFSEISLPSMRYSMFCGEALLSDVISEWQNSIPNARIINLYGPTETTVICLIYEWGRVASMQKTNNGIISIGKEMNHVNTIIVNENLELVSKGEKGELCIAGDVVTPGYWKDEEKNKSAFFIKDEKRYYRTGDLVFQDDEDDYMFAGRIDHQVKIQGWRVELAEIEHVARDYTKASMVAAVAPQTELGTTKIHLFLENYSGNVEEVTEFLKTKLPYYMVPATINVLEKFPLNINGKIDRKALSKMTEKR